MVHWDKGLRRPAQSYWRGQSGRLYALHAESLETFAMAEADLYVIAKGSHILWVGSTQDLVAEPMSRTRFRLALDCATQVLRLKSPEDRLAAVWDLEQAVPTPALLAQAA
jgi:hypothetical protein